MCSDFRTARFRRLVSPCTLMAGYPAGRRRFRAQQSSASGPPVWASGDIFDSVHSGDFRPAASAARRRAYSEGTMATIIGTPGNDTLAGTAVNDTISGLDGNDKLSDTTGNDKLDGGARQRPPERRRRQRHPKWRRRERHPYRRCRRGSDDRRRVGQRLYESRRMIDGRGDRAGWWRHRQIRTTSDNLSLAELRQCRGPPILGGPPASRPPAAIGRIPDRQLGNNVLTGGLGNDTLVRGHRSRHSEGGINNDTFSSKSARCGERSRRRGQGHGHRQQQLCAYWPGRRSRF